MYLSFFLFTSVHPCHPPCLQPSDGSFLFGERDGQTEREREREREKNRHDERAWNTGNGLRQCREHASTCVCVRKKKKSVLQEFLIMPFYPERAFVPRDRKILSSPPALRFFFPSVYADKSIPRFNTPSRIYPLNPFRWPMSRDANYTLFSLPFLFFSLSLSPLGFLKNISPFFSINSTRFSITARENLFKFLAPPLLQSLLFFFLIN